MIRLLDAFAGIGGFHLGVEKACEQLGVDFKCVGAIEFKKTSRQTYKDNFGDDIDLFEKYAGDITKIPMSEIPDHDVLTGGFPCQPFSRARHNRASSAGLHADQQDDRTSLFEYLCQILTAKNPKMFIFENVSGLLREKTSDGELMINKIIGHIKASGDDGYHVQMHVLSSHKFGAPQKRERVFFIGWRKDLDDTFRGPKPEKKPKRTANRKIQIPAGTHTPRCVGDILESDVPEKYFLHNLWSGIKNHKLPGNRYDAIRVAYHGGKWPKPTDKQNKVVTSARVEGDTPSGCSRQRDRVFNSLGLSPTLTCSTPISISIDSEDILRQLTPREYARLQTFPDSFIIPDKDGVAYGQFGNAVCVVVVEKIAHAMLKKLKKGIPSL